MGSTSRDRILQWGRASSAREARRCCPARWSPKSLQWGRASSAREAQAMGLWRGQRKPSMGPRFVSAGGADAHRERTARHPSMGPRFVSAGGKKRSRRSPRNAAFNGAALRQRGRRTHPSRRSRMSIPSMGPRFVSAGGRDHRTCHGYRDDPSMGPRFVSAGGGSCRSPLQIPFSPSMGPRFVSAGGDEAISRRRRRNNPSMGPRFVSAGGRFRPGHAARSHYLQWGRASSAREAPQISSQRSSHTSFNGAALRQRGRRPCRSG